MLSLFGCNVFKICSTKYVLLKVAPSDTGPRGVVYPFNSFPALVCLSRDFYTCCSFNCLPGYVDVDVLAVILMNHSSLQTRATFPNEHVGPGSFVIDKQMCQLMREQAQY